MPSGAAENLKPAGIGTTSPDQGETVRLATLVGLLTPGVASPGVLREAEACLDGGGENVRRLAVLALGNLQPPAVPA